MAKSSKFPMLVLVMDYICSLCKRIVGASMKEKNLHLLHNHKQQYYKALRAHRLDLLRLLSFRPHLARFKANYCNDISAKPNVQSGKANKKGYKFYRGLLYRKRGYFVEETHTCECCKLPSSSCWRYSCRDGKYLYLCPKCKDKIKPKRQYITYVSTPMGGQNKR